MKLFLSTLLHTDLYENKFQHKTPHDKQYFLSMEFKASWMSAQSFCKSYGMDLVGLASEHEAKYFLRKCQEASNFFEELSHVGGVSNTYEDNDSWYWIWSNEKIKIDLKLKNESDKKNEKNCLQLVKGQHGEFFYGRTNCYSSELQKFVCQKIIFNKLDDVTE